jgi:hypothetical protein
MLRSTGLFPARLDLGTSVAVQARKPRPADQPRRFYAANIPRRLLQRPRASDLFG